VPVVKGGRGTLGGLVMADLMSRRWMMGAMAGVVALGALPLAGLMAGAGRAANMIRMSTRYTAPPAKEGDQPTRARSILKTDEGYRGSRPPHPPYNNSLSYVNVGRDGVRVDADWRPVGSSRWSYYGAQTSGKQGEEDLAKFNPFYLPSGLVEIRFRAAGYRDRIVVIDIPRR
jgi:hypothetical protein